MSSEWDQYKTQATQQKEPSGQEESSEWDQYKIPEKKDYGLRNDGTPKGGGYFGEIKTPKGDVMTELTVGVDFDGKEEEIPLLVPTLTRGQLDYLKKGGHPSPEIVKKAVTHAQQRKGLGKSVFADEAEEGQTEVPEEVRNYLAETINKGERLTSQFLKNAISLKVLPYDLTAIAAKHYGKATSPVRFRENILSDLSNLQDQKLFGKWTEKDQNEYDYLESLIKDPEKAARHLQEDAPDLDSQSLMEKGADMVGVDLRPQDTLEAAVGWLAFLKNPKQYAKIFTSDKPIEIAKNLLKQVAPTPKEAAKTVGVVSGVQVASQNEFGPMGTIFSVILGDLLPDILTGGKDFVKHPIQTTKRVAADVSTIPAKIGKAKERIALQKEVIEKFREAGIQPDIGTITGSDFIKGFQTALDQSQFTGDKLTKFKNDLLDNITSQYKEMADQVGVSKFKNSNELGEALQTAAKVEDSVAGIYEHPKGYMPRSLKGRVDVEKDIPLSKSQKDFLHEVSPVPFANDAAAGEELMANAQKIEKPIKKGFSDRFTKLASKTESIPSKIEAGLANDIQTTIESMGKTLVQGTSSKETKFFMTAQKLLNKLTQEGDAAGDLRDVTLGQLISTKRTIGSIPNWAIRGGVYESQYKKLYHQIDTAIKEGLEKHSSKLLEEYTKLNEEYTQFKDMFENKSVSGLFRKKDIKTREIFNKAIKDDNTEAIKKILDLNSLGKKTSDKLVRDYVQSKFKGKPLTERELENIRSVIGKENEPILNKYIDKQKTFSKKAAAREGLSTAGKGDDLSKIVPPKGTEKIPKPSFNAWNPKKGLSGRVNIHQKQKASQFFNKVSKMKPEQISNMMNSISGIREMRDILSVTPEGLELYNSMARFKMDEIFRTNLETGIKNQFKTGTFSKVLNNKKNSDLVKELVGPTIFNRMIRLEARTAELAETAQKFFNASKSGSRGLDYAVFAMLGSDLTRMVLGNPWPIARSIGGLLGGRYMTNMISDPEFLKLVEESILSYKKTGFTAKLDKMVRKVRVIAEKYEAPSVKAYLESNPERE